MLALVWNNQVLGVKIILSAERVHTNLLASLLLLYRL